MFKTVLVAIHLVIFDIVDACTVLGSDDSVAFIPPYFCLCTPPPTRWALAPFANRAAPRKSCHPFTGTWLYVLDERNIAAHYIYKEPFNQDMHSKIPTLERGWDLPISKPQCRDSGIQISVK